MFGPDIGVPGRVDGETTALLSRQKLLGGSQDVITGKKGKCRLLLKGIGSEETEKAVLDICSRLGIEGYFPFPYSV